MENSDGFFARQRNRHQVEQLGGKLIREAIDYNYINNHFGGFKDILTAGFQNAGVYGHILTQAGSYLSASGTATAYASAAFDKLQAKMEALYPHQQNDQRQAEIAGNQAGWNVGKSMWNFITGHRDAKKLNGDITQELCKPTGGT